MKIAQEEIFGPVLSVIPYASEDEAVAIANDSPYGLCGSVWTKDIEHAADIAARVRTGCVAVNSATILDFHAPFGGFKKSGIGRELGPEGIGPYTEYQSIILPARAERPCEAPEKQTCRRSSSSTSTDAGSIRSKVEPAT